MHNKQYRLGTVSKSWHPSEQMPQISLIGQDLEGCEFCGSIFVNSSYFPGIQLGLSCTPSASTIFMGVKLFFFDHLNAKQSCPQNIFGMGCVQMHGFHGNPLYDSREMGIGLKIKSILGFYVC